MQTKIKGVTSAGTEIDLLADLEGLLLVGQNHSKYREAVSKGNVFSGMNQTGCVWTVGLATTYTGMAVSNPIGSGKRLSILAAGYTEVVAPTGIQAVFLAGGYHASTDVAAGVAGTPRSMLVGRSPDAVGKCWTGATLPAAPVYLLPLNQGHTSAALPTGMPVNLCDVDGLIELLPGAFVAICGFTIGVAVGAYGCIVWEEIDE